MSNHISPNTSSIYIDKSAFCSFMVASNDHYTKARTLFLELHDLERPIVSSNLVITQTHEWLMNQYGSDAAKLFLNAIEKSIQKQKIKIIQEQNDDYFHAKEIILDNPSYELSYIDTVILVLLNRYSIKRIFTFNKRLLEVHKIYPGIKVFPSQL